MKHQKVSLAHDLTIDHVYDTSDAGTGKTAVCVWAFARRRKKGGGALLVMCPRSLMHAVWQVDFKKFAPDLKVVVATAANREAAFSEQADVYITNHDASKWLVKQKKAFFDRFKNGTLVVDEITAYSSHTSQRSKAMAKVAKFFKYRRGLTATPNSISVTQMWHQVYVLDDGAHLGANYYGFQKSVQDPTQGPFRVTWEDKEGAEEAIYGILADMVVRHRFQDCVDIPPTTYLHVPYQLSTKQRRVYDAMMKKRIVDHKAEGLSDTLKAGHGGTAAQKVLQICSGAVYSDNGVAQVLDLGRYELVMDLAAERHHPVIFYFWKHQLDELARLAAARGLTYGILNGGTSDTERSAIYQRYQAGMLDGLLAHPEVVAHGYTFTRGTSIIWPNPTADIEWFRQGNARQARIGQTKKTEIVMVTAEDTVESEVYDVLMKRDARMSHLLNLFAGV